MRLLVSWTCVSSSRPCRARLWSPAIFQHGPRCVQYSKLSRFMAPHPRRSVWQIRLRILSARKRFHPTTSSLGLSIRCYDGSDAPCF
ncbi:hypothetical protein BC567DRAFT_216074 [Phyllosticta citribraziliensis]